MSRRRRGRSRRRPRRAGTRSDQRTDLFRGKVEEGLDMVPGDDEHMPGEHRPLIEERDHDIVVEHDMARLRSRDDGAERARRTTLGIGLGTLGRHRGIMAHASHRTAAARPLGRGGAATRSRGDVRTRWVAPQHLRHAREPSQADEALGRVRQPRAREELALGARSRAPHPPDGMELPCALRVGPTCRHRAAQRHHAGRDRSNPGRP